MKAIEVSCNGKRLFTAGLADGILDARLVIRNEADPIWFEVVGRDRSTGGHTRWARDAVKLGDTITMTLVEVDPSDVDGTSGGTAH